MNKKIIYIAILLGLTIQLIGCEKKDQEAVKRIVLESDVRKPELNLENINYKEAGEIVNFKLDKGDYFYPAFYHEGEMYGYISKGIGKVTKGGIYHPTTEPTREHLYKVGKDNTLIETSKEAVDCMRGCEKLLGFAYGKGDLVFSIDYTKEDKPREIPELTAAIKELKGKSENVYSVSECGDYVIIRESEPYDGGAKIYFYDMNNKKIYEKKDEEDVRFNNFYYVDSLKSVMCIGKDLKLYRLKFEENRYYLEEYLNLNDKGYMDKVEAVMINGDEMLILEEELITDVRLWKDKLISISKFNFKTNQHNILFEAPREVIMNIREIKNNILIMEELKEKDGTMVPIKRYFKKVDGNNLINLSEQNVEDDNWDAIFQDEFNKIEERNRILEWILISEDEREMIFTMRLTNLKNGVETTKDIIHKKYKIR
ncbi:hypothetical protein [Clostridium butanoliproducens]|uniref:hypothetical protein n=1 Tax=Clostridium butanoliproducens TaxID=2991837 RepID=UPI0024BAA923|nr:hypothetical protein [Clostridium butanoliproducens]